MDQPAAERQFHPNASVVLIHHALAWAHSDFVEIIALARLVSGDCILESVRGHSRRREDASGDVSVRLLAL
jgi:hypothetical protein